mgnify:CR=1 FL=1
MANLERAVSAVRAVRPAAGCRRIRYERVYAADDRPSVRLARLSYAEVPISAVSSSTATSSTSASTSTAIIGRAEASSHARSTSPRIVDHARAIWGCSGEVMHRRGTSCTESRGVCRYRSADIAHREPRITARSAGYGYIVGDTEASCHARPTCPRVVDVSGVIWCGLSEVMHRRGASRTEARACDRERTPDTCTNASGLTRAATRGVARRT